MSKRKPTKHEIEEALKKDYFKTYNNETKETQEKIDDFCKALADIF